MNGKLMSICCGVALVSVLAVAPLAFVRADQNSSQDAINKAKEAGKKAAKDAEDAAKKLVEKAKEQTGMGDEGMPASMAEYMEVTEHHKRLAQWVGEWDITSKFFMGPDMPPIENKMKAVTKSMMGGRYFVEKVTGQISMGDGAPPMEFEGMSVMGYDNHKKKHFSTWMDNMSTGMWMEWGTCSEDGKVITSSGENFNSMTGTMEKTTSICTIIDEDNRTLEMFGPGPDGSRVKTMEMHYKRIK